MNDQRERGLPKWAKEELRRLRMNLHEANEKLSSKIGQSVQRGHHGVTIMDPSCPTLYRSVYDRSKAIVSDGEFLVEVCIQDGIATVRASHKGAGGMVIAPRAANSIEIRRDEHL